MRNLTLTLIILALFCAIAYAQIPHIMRYQGVLLDKQTQQALTDGDYTVTFRIYDSEGNKLWEEAQTIDLKSGTFSVLLGKVTPLEIPWDQDYSLTLQLQGEDEMSPPQQITPVPLALKAEKAEIAQKSMTIEGDVIYVDSENKMVGINTTQPQATLDVAGDTNTQLLLHFNNNFNDETGKTVTPQGSTEIDTNPANNRPEFGGASALFDGDGDYLSIPYSDDWNFGSGDFTIDFWVRFNTFDTNVFCFVNQWEDATHHFLFRLGWGSSADKKLYFVCRNAIGYIIAEYATSPLTLNTGTWYHIALARSGSTIYMFLDGISQTLTVHYAIGNQSIADYAAPLNIGSADGVGGFHNGWLDEIRISKGIARWTEDFSDQLPKREYTSTALQVSGKTIFEGNVGIGTANPQASLEVTGDIDTNTKLLLHLNDSFTDETGKTVTPQGDAAIDTSQSKFGGGSSYFDGDGDYLLITDSEDWDFGSGDFTIDFWVRFDDASGYQYFCAQAGAGNYDWWCRKEGSNKLELIFYDSGEVTYDGRVYTNDAFPFENNKWYHLAFVRSGATGFIFVDGISQVASVTSFGTLEDYDNTSDLLIGADQGGFGGVKGWLDEFRISKGIARWTSNFTPPSREYAGGDAIFAGEVKAKKFTTGDITFQKDGQTLWRMFEEEDGLYLESLLSGKVYQMEMEEIADK